MSEFIEIEENGDIVARATLLKKITGSDEPVYYVSDVRVSLDLRGKGLGSMLVKQINLFLDASGAVGYFVDITGNNSDNLQAKGIYERHGWIKIDDHLMIYGVQNDKS